MIRQVKDGQYPTLHGNALEWVKDGQHNTLLHIAAQSGNCVTQLMKDGANKEAKNRLGQTPIHLAALSGQLSAVIDLINGGASVTVKDSSGETPLHKAVRCGHQLIC